MTSAFKINEYPNADIFIITYQENKAPNSSTSSPVQSLLRSNDQHKQDQPKEVSNKQLIKRVLQKISAEYAIFRYTSYDENRDYQEYLKKQLQSYKLTKRKLVFGCLYQKGSEHMNLHNVKAIHYQHVPFGYNSQVQLNINSLPKKLSRTSTIIDGKIYVNLNQSFQQILAQTIKHFQLDFVWLGVTGRLGTDVQQFREIIVELQNFNVQKMGYYDLFFNQLQNTLKYRESANQISKRQLNSYLNQSLKIADDSHIDSMNKLTQQLIRHKFNTRIIIDDIVSHDYINLLSSRNYFNLLFIEEGALKRFQNFQSECQKRFPNIKKILSLQNFLFIQDFWYRKLIMKLMVYVKFTIQRQNQVEQDQSYFRLIKKNYKQIIPPFRPSFDEYFLQVCKALKSRSGCIKEAVGSIIVKNKRIVATGYNGTPLNTINCYKGGCKICNNSQKMLTQVLSCCCIHAEYGCILQAGIKVANGAILYSTKLPCLWCSKLLVQGRLAKVVYLKSKCDKLQYENVLLVKAMLQKGNVELIQLSESKQAFSV